MRDIGLFMDQIEAGRNTAGAESKFKEYLSKSEKLLPTINAYRTRLILGYVNLPEISADDKIRVTLSLHDCIW